MNMVIDARISDNAGQQIRSNLLEDIKRSPSIYVTDRSLNTFAQQNLVCGIVNYFVQMQKILSLTIRTHCPKHKIVLFWAMS